MALHSHTKRPQIVQNNKLVPRLCYYYCTGSDLPDAEAIDPPTGPNDGQAAAEQKSTGNIFDLPEETICWPIDFCIQQLLSRSSTETGNNYEMACP